MDSKQASSRTSAPPPCRRLILSITAHARASQHQRKRSVDSVQNVELSLLTATSYFSTKWVSSEQQSSGLDLFQFGKSWGCGAAFASLASTPRIAVRFRPECRHTTPISPVSTPARRESRIGPRRNALLHLFWFSYFPPSLIVAFFPSVLFPSSSLVLIANFGVRQFGISLLLRTLYICHQHESIR